MDKRQVSVVTLTKVVGKRKKPETCVEVEKVTRNQVLPDGENFLRRRRRDGERELNAL